MADSNDKDQAGDLSREEEEDNRATSSDEWRPGEPLILTHADFEDEPAPAGEAGGASDLFEAGPGFVPVALVAACTSKLKPFLMLFRPNPDGTLSAYADQPLPPTAEPPQPDADAKGDNAVAKAFLLNEYAGCPFCGATTFARCSCGAILCTGGVYKTWRGEHIKCPLCGSEGELELDKPARSAARFFGKGKPKKTP